MDNKIVLPNSLNLDKYISTDKMHGQPFTYELKSICLHHGDNIDFGHYSSNFKLQLFTKPIIFYRDLMDYLYCFFNIS